MSADTPKCAKLNHFLKKIRGNMLPNPLAMYCNTSKRPQK